VTATNAKAPLVDWRWIKAETQISSMRSDEIGKQDLPEELLDRAKPFCDLPNQVRRIGELQHAKKQQ
jgi:ornithine cyclodeaminase/alanine dehydrogenase-like protein (mu-crystallin family)